MSTAWKMLAFFCSMFPIPKKIDLCSTCNKWNAWKKYHCILLFLEIQISIIIIIIISSSQISRPIFYYYSYYYYFYHHYIITWSYHHILLYIFINNKKTTKKKRKKKIHNNKRRMLLSCNNHFELFASFKKISNKIDVVCSIL